jgi:uncharacterized protein (TIGR02118 family)
MIMFKAIILLKRKDELSSKDFADWWLGRHAPLARGLPNVRRVVFNLVEDGPYDGVAELWFDTQAAFEASYATDHGRAVAADTLAVVDQRVRMFVTEHSIAGDTAR